MVMTMMKTATTPKMVKMTMEMMTTETTVMMIIDLA